MQESAMFKKKILIIDDTELMVKLITDILSDKGYMVVSAHNGVEGIKMVAAEKPDLLLLDIVMPGLDGFEVCKLLRDDESNNLMPIIILTAQGNEDDKLTGLELGADDYITKPFNPRELISRVHNTLLRIDRNRWANPLTGLPGNIEIQSEINQRIAQNLKFAVLYLDVDNFKSYNDVYGFARGDRAIKMMADILSDMVHTFGSPGDFTGHIGGDDYVVITTPEYADVLCEIIIKEFGEKIPELYSKEDRDAGFIYTTNRKGYMTKYPVMTLSIAVVTNEHRELLNHIHVSEISAELKKKAKSIQGSVYLKDRRTQ
jgi:diguanylate cyclase (GGDEF)-like protein